MQTQIDHVREALKILHENYSGWARDGAQLAANISFVMDAIRPSTWYDHRLVFLTPERDLTPLVVASLDQAFQAIEKLPKDATIIDLCCGNGWFSRYCYGRKGHKVVSIDINPLAIEQAQLMHSAPNISYVCGDANKVLRGMRAGLVIMRSALGQFPAAARAELLNNIREVIGDWGRFIGDVGLAHVTGGRRSGDIEVLDCEEKVRDILVQAFVHPEVHTWTRTWNDRGEVFWDIG